MMRRVLLISGVCILASCSSGAGLSSVGGIGKSVAYFSRQGDQWQVIAHNLWEQTSQVIPVTGTPRGRPLLAEQGNVVVFVTDAGLFLADMDTGDVLGIVSSVTGEPFVSADGRFVVFTSLVDTLVPDDTNNAADVFLFDRQNHRISRQSLLPESAQNTQASYIAAVSADGRYIVFRTQDALYIRDILKSITSPAPQE